MSLVAERWTSSTLDPADRVDAFRELISATHLPWSLAPPVDGPPGSDELTRYRIGDLTLIDCRCGPCSGSRGGSQLAATSDDVVGVLFVRSGLEYVEAGGSWSVVRPGAALVWRGDEPVRFTLPGRLHKWTLLVPSSRLPLVRSGPLDADATGLLTSLLGTTLASAGSLPGRLGQPVADAAVALLRGAIAPGSSDEATWLRVTAFVQRNLRDPSLTPAAIAAGTFVSVRSLYAVFAARGTSPARYVRSSRLAAAHRELALRGTAVTVAEVAHGWGFGDQATFSRGFRAAFRRTPDEVRRSLPAGASRSGRSPRT
jgi:AraC-like DNA-binding protein